MSELNVKIGVNNILKGKGVFKVEDLIKILKTIHPETPIKFGVMTSSYNARCFSQDEDFIFSLQQRENTLEDYDTMEILTILKDIEL